MNRLNDSGNIRSLKLKVFVSAFVMFIIGILPILVVSKGIYLWTGDFEYQNIPFIHYLVEKWQTEIPLWDWYSDLGMNFTGSYAFYGLASPVVLLGILFSDHALYYGLGFIYGLLFAFAALSSCMYAEQYVKKQSSAFICGILYAFSGFQIYNMVFMFADVIAMFPLLLYCFDKLIHEKRPAGFAVMLALSGIVNYYFLWGECVFLLIYFIVKTVTRQIKLDLRLFLQLAFETVLGIAGAAVILVPSFITVSGNTRASSLIFDTNLLAYDAPVIWKIVQSVFILPEFCNSGAFFTGYPMDVASVSLYIPIFCVIGVISVFRKNKKSWYSLLLSVCIIMMCIPLLNSIFSAFNAGYYARWFNMPLLIMIMMTGKYIDNIETSDVKTEIKLHWFMMILFAAYGIFLLIYKKGSFTNCLTTDFIIMYALSFLGLVLITAMLYQKKSSFLSLKNLRKVVCVFCTVVLCGYSVLNCMALLGTAVDVQIERFNIEQPVVIDDDENFRIVTDDSNNNAPMMWHYPQINLYHSLVSGSTVDFLELAGLERTQVFDIDSSVYALCSFLSVKYDFYFNASVYGAKNESEDLLYKRKGFDLADTQGNYVIYENENYIPMGFTFDYCLNENYFSETEKDEVESAMELMNSDKEENTLTTDEKQKIMLKAIVLNDEQIEKYGDILPEISEKLLENTSDYRYEQDCRERKASAAYEFTPDSKGFTSKIKLDRDNLVFYSVPYDKGFTAYVDGAETEIEKVFGGLCAVKVPAGDHEITFEYTDKYLKTGIAVSCVSAAVLLIYGALSYISGKRRKENEKN